MNNPLKSDYSLSVFSKVSTAAIGLISSAFSTRYLGLEFKGEYNLIIQTVNILVLILNLGFYQSYSYNYRKYGPSIFKKYILVFIIQFITYLIIAGLLTAVSKSLQIGMIAFLTPIQILRVQMDNIMLVQNVRNRLHLNIFSSVFLLISYALLYIFVPSALLPAVIALAAADIIIVSIYFIKNRVKLSSADIDLNFSKEIFKFGFLPMISSLLVTVNYSVGVFFLKGMSTPEQLSLYSMATGIMNYVWMVPDAFKDVIFSKVAREKNSSSVNFSVKFSLIFLIIVTLGFAVFGKIFISIMYGFEFLGAYKVTLLLFLGVFSMIFFKIFGIVFLAEGKRIAHFLILSISAVCNIIINIILVPKLGMYGSALASVISYNTCGILFLVYYAKSKNEKIKNIILITKDDLKLIKDISSKKGVK